MVVSLDVHCACGGCEAFFEEDVPGATWYPPDWELVAELRGPSERVLLCPVHSSALREWELGVCLRLSGRLEEAYRAGDPTLRVRNDRLKG